MPATRERQMLVKKGGKTRVNTREKKPPSFLVPEITPHNFRQIVPFAKSTVPQ